MAVANAFRMLKTVRSLLNFERKLTLMLGIEQNGDASCIFLLQLWFVFIPKLLSEAAFLYSVCPQIPLHSVLFLGMLLYDPGKFFRISIIHSNIVKLNRS